MSSHDSQEQKEAAVNYLDLLASTLTEHEKNLDKLIENLHEVSDKIGSSLEKYVKANARPRESLIYIRLNFARSRPIEELKTILETLKEGVGTLQLKGEDSIISTIELEAPPKRRVQASTV